MSKFAKKQCNRHLLKKTLAIVVGLVLLCSSFLSIFFVVHESNHYCIGHHCPICATIDKAQQILKNPGTPDAVAPTSGFSYLIIILITGLIYFMPESQTLVSLKERLDN